MKETAEKDKRGCLTSDHAMHESHKKVRVRNLRVIRSVVHTLRWQRQTPQWILRRKLLWICVIEPKTTNPRTFWHSNSSTRAARKPTANRNSSNKPQSSNNQNPPHLFSVGEFWMKIIEIRFGGVVVTPPPAVCENKLITADPNAPF